MKQDTQPAEVLTDLSKSQGAEAFLRFNFFNSLDHLERKYGSWNKVKVVLDISISTLNLWRRGKIAPSKLTMAAVILLAVNNGYQIEFTN